MLGFATSGKVYLCNCKCEDLLDPGYAQTMVTPSTVDPVIGITTDRCPVFDLLFSGEDRLSNDGSFCHILLQW